ncbi:MAG TPA: UDP-N-acetylglucosamine 2-epimerase (non-hydrolyzing) [Planctomycetaceae bacterium]
MAVALPLTLIAGARPNFMKIAPLARALSEAGAAVRIVHTGQHYDERMSGAFFRELDIPEPDVNLGVGSGTHVAQISEVMRRLEAEFNEHTPSAVVVVGDVNSTLAAALTAVKLGLPVAHVEAGLRSGDRTMPEETNRIVTDAVSDWLFTSEPAGAENLRREGVAEEKIHFAGNVMIDTLQAHVASARALDAPASFGLEPRRYAVLTLHRPSNVDDPERLGSIMKAIRTLAGRMPVVFPVHPRTAGRIREFGFDGGDGRLMLVEPQSYLPMLGLVDSARLVLTDSGGLQEETTALRVPCLTLRENTERPVTVEVGSNRLVGWRTDAIVQAFERVLDGPERTGRLPDMWDGRAAERIAAVLAAMTKARV